MTDSNSSTDRPEASLERVFQRGLQSHKSQKFQEAHYDYLEVLKQQPDHFGAVYLLGLLYHQIGKADDALACLSKATQLDPAHSEAHANLGIVLHSLNRYEEAIDRYDRALTQNPDSPETHYNKGISLSGKGDLTQAVESFRQAINLRPDYASAHNNLGNAYDELGHLDKALSCYRHVLSLDASHKNAHFNVGSILAKQGHLKDAETSYLKALEIDPDYVEGINNLGNIYLATWRYEEAVAAFDRALTLDPRSSNIHVNKGNAYRGKCRTREAIDCFREALSLNPAHAEAHSNLVLTMGYDAETTAAEIRQEAKNWNNAHACKTTLKKQQTRSGEDRPLRIGFVSADFNNHPVSDFLINILPRLNPEKTSLFAYYNSHTNDSMTETLKGCFAKWRDVVALNDHQLAAKIQTDQIDVLIDLSGHTSNNRLKMFSLKPAPVQATWLGYGGTTGLQAMDFIICDKHVVPENDEVYFTETPWRLPDVWVCFSPPDFDIEVNPLPALETGIVTFASFNSLAKVTDQTIACWSEVLLAVPESRLILKAIQLADDSIRKDVLKRFETCGIPADRLVLKGRTSTKAEHLADYHEVDIALDPFPYAGGTTSVEAFWMGVPVLAKRGELFVSNMGVSLGRAVGLEDWIADSEQDYVAKAQKMSSELSTLSDLRARLRPNMMTSPLCDATRFARNFEDACLGMWQSVMTIPPG